MVWETIIEGAIMGFWLGPHFFRLYRQSHRTSDLIPAIVAGLTSILFWIRLGHLLGLWPFTIG